MNKFIVGRIKMKSNINKQNYYRVTVEQITTEDESNPKALQFELEDREDMFALVDTLKHRSELDEQVATRVGVALRLLGPVMVQNKKHPLFDEFMPHFKNFMINLKKAMKNS